MSEQYKLIELDLSNCPNLTYISLENMRLEKLNLKNGNPTIIESFYVSTSNAICVQVDDADYFVSIWSSRLYPSTSSFSEDCGI